MTWNPIDRSELEAMISRDLMDCAEDQKQVFARARVTPRKWKLSPWGDAGGGFWVVATCRDRVLWYNDIEEGFNVSRYEIAGEIPTAEYWCNQDPLRWAIPRLEGDSKTYE
jgi:hypothetical protein